MNFLEKLKAFCEAHKMTYTIEDRGETDLVTLSAGGKSTTFSVVHDPANFPRAVE